MVVRSTLSLATRASTNSTMPIGGCSRPIIRLSTITRPKCTGSTPSCRAIGSRIGTRIVIAAVGSRKQPTNSISRLASSRNSQASLVKPSTQAAMAGGDAGGGEHPAEDRRRGDDEHHGGGGLHGVEADLDEHLPRQRAVPGQAQHHGPGAGGDGAFGGREDAGGHAADQQHRRHDGQHGLEPEQRSAANSSTSPMATVSCGCAPACTAPTSPAASRPPPRSRSAPCRSASR
jgi:hypothetical protein